MAARMVVLSVQMMAQQWAGKMVLLLAEKKAL